MKPRTPPRLAEWLLQRLAASYRRDSLLGDVLEQYQQGRSRAWYWGQVGSASSWALLRFARSATVTRAARVILRVTGEILAILKRFATAFAIVTLGAATLTWAAGGAGSRIADAAPSPAHCSADSR